MLRVVKSEVRSRVREESGETLKIVRAGCARITTCRDKDAGAPPSKNEIALLSPEDVSSAISMSYESPE